MARWNPEEFETDAAASAAPERGGDRASAGTAGAAATDLDAGFDRLLDGVGARLRALRARRGLTLSELSEQTGVSVSTLSRLESGGRRPTLDLLVRLAAVYRASLDDLVGAPQIADPRVHPKPFFRNGRAIIPLTRSNPDVHAYKMVLPGHPPEQPVEQSAHEGYDWIYVLSGRVRLALGDEEIVLEAGEAAEFDTRTLHGHASASGTQPAEVLNLLSTQGERVHLRGTAGSGDS
ncbi:helix-turn-helix domain-containing protein [Agromyces salentinus]|uniref:XRE family transcriptional regulator n=1 Tax=Agromyces salentinus TaxID=269421 RepID=A0ABN2MF64_9MICO|nr:XRE family transcriptional regulator [Agromyces salentinus]